MIKNYTQYINEDIRSKNVSLPEVIYDNLKQLNPDIQVHHTDDYKIVISTPIRILNLHEKFYEALAKDNIDKDDIIFEDCAEIRLYSVDGFISISDYGIFQSGIKVFSCADCKKITSLHGVPEKVSGSFYCSDCLCLTSLEFAPKEVGDNFGCSRCDKLTSLEGSPKKVPGIFYCSDCKKLTSIEGTPEIVSEFYCIECNDSFIKLAIEKYGDKVIS